MALCSIENITKQFNNGEIICPIDSLSLEINKGDFISIEGPSGTGKSTLLYLIGGLIRPTNGKIIYNGIDISSMNDKSLTEWRRSEMGFIFQETILFPALTIRENLVLSQQAHKKTTKNNYNTKADFYLDLMGLSNRSDYLPHQLSVGQRRRLIIACALINDPSLVLVDEPTNDLDNVWSLKIIELLKEKAKTGSAVIMVTHNEKWAQFANLHYTLSNGKLFKVEVP